MWTQNNVEYLLYYLYDENGAPIGLQYRTSNYASGVFDFFFFDKNLQGDIIGIYNAEGEKICTYTYDAWGVCELNGVSGVTLSAVENYVAANNPFRYRGYYYDTETGLYYLQSRYYNPEWGRFLNADACLYNNLLGFNLYAYCVNKPTVYVDPTGEWFGIDDVITGPIDEIIVIGGLLLLGACGVEWADEAIDATTEVLTGLYDGVGDIIDWVHASTDTTPTPTPSKDRPKDEKGRPIVNPGDIPGEEEGYYPPKNGPKTGKIGKDKGWVDKNGNIWVPAPTGSGKDHGGGHWDVNRKDGKGYINVYPGGKFRPGSGKIPIFKR